MQTRTAYTFDLDDKDSLSVCRHSNSVNLTNASLGPEDFNIRFRPVHLPELREVILELEALQTMQRQKDEQAISESGVPV